MRKAVSILLATAALLAAGSAAAQEPPVTKPANPDMEFEEDVPPQKAWSVGAGFETDRTILQEDVGGRIKAFNTASINGSYAFGRNDRVAVMGGIIQRFIADPTETGVRADDILVSYAHTFRLPAELNLTATVSDSIPIGYYSQLMGLIALPRASLGLSRSFLDHTLNLSIRGGGAYYVVKYKEAEGQIGVNPMASVDLGFMVSYSLPFHRQLSVSAGASTGYQWQYNPDHQNDATLKQQFANAPVEPSADQFFGENPPSQQRYGGSVSLQYDLPTVIGVGSTIQLQLSQGDGVYRDGATHLYWLSRRGGQISAGISANY